MNYSDPNYNPELDPMNYAFMIANHGPNHKPFLEGENIEGMNLNSSQIVFDEQVSERLSEIAGRNIAYEYFSATETSLFESFSADINLQDMAEQDTAGGLTRQQIEDVIQQVLEEQNFWVRNP